MKRISRFLVLMMLFFSLHGHAENEVLGEKRTEVIIREHPKTGESYISIVQKGVPIPDDPLFDGRQKYDRPDYRLLEKGVYAKDLDYEGPYSSKKKIYILAASLATIGTVGALAMPVAASTGAAGSAMGPGIGAAAMGTASAAAVIKLDLKNLPEDHMREGQSELLEHETDFYRLFVEV